MPEKKHTPEVAARKASAATIATDHHVLYIGNP